MNIVLRTGPAGRTGSTWNRRGIQFGSYIGPAMLSNRWKPAWLGQTRWKPVNRRFYRTGGVNVLIAGKWEQRFNLLKNWKNPFIMARTGLLAVIKGNANHCTIASVLFKSYAICPEKKFGKFHKLCICELYNICMLMFVYFFFLNIYIIKQNRKNKKKHHCHTT